MGIHSFSHSLQHITLPTGRRILSVILKSSASAELMTAIRCVLRGEAHACPRFAAISLMGIHSFSHSLQHITLPTGRRILRLQTC